MNITVLFPLSADMTDAITLRLARCWRHHTLVRSLLCCGKCGDAGAPRGRRPRVSPGAGSGRAGVSGAGGFLQIDPRRRIGSGEIEVRGVCNLRQPTRGSPYVRGSAARRAVPSARRTRQDRRSPSGGHAPSPAMHTGYTVAASAAALASDGNLVFPAVAEIVLVTGQVPGLHQITDPDCFSSSVSSSSSR